MARDAESNGARDAGADDTGEAERPAAAEGPLDQEALMALVGYPLRRAQLKVFEDFAQACAPLDLRPGQFSALALIDANPGRSQRALAEALGVQRPNFVAMMDGLERRGLARRDVSPADRRSHAVTLTDAGRALLAEAMTRARAHNDRITAALTPAERATLIALLRRI